MSCLKPARGSFFGVGTPTCVVDSADVTDLSPNRVEDSQDKDDLQDGTITMSHHDYCRWMLANMIVKVTVQSP